MDQDSSIGAEEDSPADKITVTIHEYGNVMMATPLLNGTIPNGIMEAAQSMIDRQAQEIREVLDICGDAEIIDNFKIIEGPHVDPLMRFKPLGFYGKFASANYDKLAAHFSCRRQHIPEEITLTFINEMIDRYSQQQRYRDDEEYDDY